MPSIKKILCAVDFSETSEFALDYAIELGREFGAEIHLLHVYEVPMYSYPDVPKTAGADLVSQVSRAAIAALSTLADRKRIVHWRAKEGIPHRVIVTTAGDIHADLIVIGTHGRSGFQRFILGSTAERVVRASSIPVLTIRHPESER